MRRRTGAFASIAAAALLATTPTVETAESDTDFYTSPPAFETAPLGDVLRTESSVAAVVPKTPAVLDAAVTRVMYRAVSTPTARSRSGDIRRAAWYPPRPPNSPRRTPRTVGGRRRGRFTARRPGRPRRSRRRIPALRRDRLGRRRFHLGDEPWASLVAEQQLSNRAPAMPVFVAQSTGDDLVLVQGVDPMVDEWCSAGADVTYRRYDVGPVLTKTGTGHLIGMFPAVVEGLDWLDQRFSGRESQSDCTA